MAYKTAVVRKNTDDNFLIVFPTEEAWGDTCRAFLPTDQGVHINELESHNMGYISRGAYLQTTMPVTDEEADHILRLYSKHHCPQQANYRALDKWARP